MRERGFGDRRGLAFVIAHAGAIVLAAATLTLSGLAILDAVSQRACPLGLEFERTGSELVGFRPFPPRATCRYVYREAGSDRFRPEIVTTDASVATLAATASVLILVTASVRLRRWTRTADLTAFKQRA